MQKKLTITIDERVYDGLHNVIGRRRISRFIESLVRPHVVGADLEASYRQMASDEAREAEASNGPKGPSGMSPMKRGVQGFRAGDPRPVGPYSVKRFPRPSRWGGEKLVLHRHRLHPVSDDGNEDVPSPRRGRNHRARWRKPRGNRANRRAHSPEPPNGGGITSAAA